MERRARVHGEGRERGLFNGFIETLYWFVGVSQRAGFRFKMETYMAASILLVAASGPQR
jgi:hypothetical protein